MVESYTDCQSCTAVIELDGANYQTSKEHTLQAQTNGTVQMTITSTESEHVYYSLIEVIDENCRKFAPHQAARLFTFILSNASSSHRA